MPTKKRVLAKSWEEFCEITKRDPQSLPDISLLDEAIGKRVIADFKLSTMILHYNGKLPDLTDSSVYKYEPWWRVVKDDTKPSGVGLSYCDYVNWVTCTYVGPRFAYLETDVLEHVTKYFIAEYNDLLL